MTVVHRRRLILDFRPAMYRPRDSNMKKPSKTAAELEASIKVEMEDICDWPTDMAISVQPDGDSWKVWTSGEGGFFHGSLGRRFAIWRFDPSRPKVFLDPPAWPYGRTVVYGAVPRQKNAPACNKSRALSPKE